MQTWYSIHVWPNASNFEDFLTQTYLPFCVQHIWNTRETRSFFIRYLDDERGQHARLRFRGEADWLENTLKPQLEKALHKKGEWEAVAYQPEPDRFGGEEALAWAEDHFHIGTRVVLSRLAQPKYEYGQAIFDAMRLSLMASRAAGLSQTEACAYFDQLANQYIRSFFVPDDGVDSETFLLEVRADFQENLEQQYSYLNDSLAQTYQMVEDESFDKSHAEFLRWYKGNQIILDGLKEHKAQALPHLLHLTFNRLGIANQDEAFLLYALGARQ